MRVAILHDDRLASGRTDEADSLTQVDAVRVGLRRRGHVVTTVPFAADTQRTARRLQKIDPDCVFNLVESVAGWGQLIAWAPSLLETLRIPFTGAPSDAMTLTTNKTLTKRLLRLHDLPTPDWLHGDHADPLVGRCILKPVREDASFAIDDAAVVDLPRTPDAGAVRARCAHRAAETEREILAEAFIEGREVNVALLARDFSPELLPIAEIEFTDYPAEKPRIVGYAAKWATDSFECHNTTRRFDTVARWTPLSRELSALALRCWHVFGLRGYARIDFRVDAAGRPWILEVNANPCLSPDAGFAAAAAQAGLSFGDVVDRIVDASLASHDGESSDVPNSAHR